MWSNCQHAGQELAKKLAKFTVQTNTIILGLPRGGVVVAAEVAKALNLPLDIIVTRKIGAPLNEELAIGAIDEKGNAVWHDHLLKMLHVSKEYLDQTVATEKKEAERRLKIYRGDRPPLDLKEKNVILIDDGVATGATMFAAIKSGKQKGAKKVIVAVPVVAADTLIKLKQRADEVIYLDAPADFGAVGQFYREFAQTSDEEVIALLKESGS